MLIGQITSRGSSFGGSWLRLNRLLYYVFDNSNVIARETKSINWKLNATTVPVLPWIPRALHNDSFLYEVWATAGGGWIYAFILPRPNTLSHLPNVNQTVCICPVIRNRSKLYRVLLSPVLHPSTKFNENQASLFLTSLEEVKNKQTNKPFTVSEITVSQNPRWHVFLFHSSQQSKMQRYSIYHPTKQRNKLI